MKKIARILLWFLGFLALLLIGVVLAAYTYYYFQKPVFVNKSLAFHNKLSIPQLLEPKIENGKEIVDLTIQKGMTEFFPGKPASTMGINRNYLGPTIRMHTGDNIKIHITNNLPLV